MLNIVNNLVGSFTNAACITCERVSAVRKFLGRNQETV